MRLAFNTEAGPPPLIASIWGGRWPGSRASISLPCRRALTHRSVKKWFKKKKAWTKKGKREGAGHLVIERLGGLRLLRGSWVLRCPPALDYSPVEGSVPPFMSELQLHIHTDLCWWGRRRTLRSSLAPCHVQLCESYPMNSDHSIYSFVSSWVVFQVPFPSICPRRWAPDRWGHAVAETLGWSGEAKTLILLARSFPPPAPTLLNPPFLPCPPDSGQCCQYSMK